MKIVEQPAGTTRHDAEASPNRPAPDVGFDALLDALAQGLPAVVGASAGFARQAAGRALPEPGGLAKELAARHAAHARSGPHAEPAGTKPIVKAAQDELRSASERAIGRDASARPAGERDASPGRGDRAASASDGRPNAAYQSERGPADRRDAAQHSSAAEKADHARQATNNQDSASTGAGKPPLPGSASGVATRVLPQATGASPAQNAAVAGNGKGGDAGALRSLTAIGTALDRAFVRGTVTTARAAQGQHTPRDSTAEAFRAQVARGLAAALRRGDGQVVLRLHPESLGLVRVSMGVRDGTVTARLEPTTSSARELLENGLSSLRAALEARGLHVDRLVVHSAAQSMPDGKAEPSSDDGGERDRAGGDGATRTGPEGHGRSDPRDAGAEADAGDAPPSGRAATDGAGWGGASWTDGSAEIVVTADGAAVPITIDLVA